VPGTTDIGNHGNDTATQIILPFPFTLYDTTYNTANVSSNGNLQFTTALVFFSNSCLPLRFNWQATIFAYWMDLRTDGTTCQGGDCGIYTSITGSAPNRILNVEWRTRYVSGGGLANFEVRLYEGLPSRFDIVIGNTVTTTHGPTGGVQNENATLWRNAFCLQNPPANTVYSFVGACTTGTTPTFTYTPSVGPTGTEPVRTSTPTPTRSVTGTPPRTNTPTVTGTGTEPMFTSTPSTTRTPTRTTTPTSTHIITPTPCSINFSDVHPDDYFYEAVRYLYCAGVISGYPDNTFRPYNNTTRAQLCKIVVLAEGWPIDTSGGPHFSDVPPNHTFYGYIETSFNHGIISGYADGTFRPYNNATRGQICKIVYEVVSQPYGRVTAR
jgi:hypothetical protein